MNMRSTSEPHPERRVLWVDAQAEELESIQLQLKSHRITIECVPDFELALEKIRSWEPHILQLEYAQSAKGMHYETFVYEELPLVDPYGAGGPLFDNPWGYTAIPILLVTGGPPVLVPGHVTPLLQRVNHFIPKPCNVSHVVQRVRDLLRIPSLGLVLDPDRRRVLVRGTPQLLSPRKLEILKILAGSYPHPLTALQLARELHDKEGIQSSENQVRATVQKLRQSLETNPTEPQLLCNHGHGYFLSDRPQWHSARTGDGLKERRRGGAN